MKIIFNLLGIALYFLIRYNKRTNKEIKFSGTFWLNDNWAETIAILGVDLAMMLLVLKKDLVIDLNTYLPALPAGVAFTGDLAICFFIGLFLSAAIYELFKTKVKK